MAVHDMPLDERYDDPPEAKALAKARSKLAKLDAAMGEVLDMDPPLAARTALLVARHHVEQMYADLGPVSGD